MNVYLVIHDEGMYEGGSEVFGVYLDRATAEASVVSRTPSGARSKAWSAHNESCCGVVEFEVRDAPNVDIQEDDQPFDPNGPRLISDALADRLTSFSALANPYRTSAS